MPPCSDDDKRRSVPGQEESFRLSRDACEHQEFVDTLNKRLDITKRCGKPLRVWTAAMRAQPKSFSTLLASAAASRCHCTDGRVQGRPGNTFPLPSDCYSIPRAICHLCYRVRLSSGSLVSAIDERSGITR